MRPLIMLTSPDTWRCPTNRFHFLLLIMWSVLFTASAKAADDPEAELRKARIEFWKYWDTRDAAGLATMMTDDFVQFSAQATFLDKATFLADLKAGKYSKIDKRNLDDVVDPRVRFYGSVAIVTYSAPRLATGAPGSFDAATPRTRITEVWAKVKGAGWRIANFQVSVPAGGDTTLPRD